MSDRRRSALRRFAWSWLLVLGVGVACGGAAGGFFAFDPTSLKPGLSGAVRDVVSASGIAGASVTVQGKQAITGASGEYHLDDLRSGRYVAVVAHRSYASLEREVEITSNVVNFAHFELAPLP